MTRDNNTFISSLSQAARDNPLAAALIGGGALWLLLGNRPIGNALGGIASAAQPLAESGMRGVSSAADAAANVGRSASESVADGARSASRATGETMSDGASALRDRMSETINRASEGFSRAAETLSAAPNPMPHLQKGYAGAQSALTDLFERQPLALGLIGLAIGAGAATAVASTAFENEWAGSLSDDVKEAVKDRAEHVAETAQRAAGEAGSEFRAAAGEAVSGLRKAGEEAVQTAQDGRRGAEASWKQVDQEPAG
jgi:hypothetical protein